MHEQQARLVVFSSLFPHRGAPNAGVFIRERMFRVGESLPLTVVSPQPWFPGQALIRIFRPHFRRPAPKQDMQQGINILYPRFLCVPGILKQFDGIFMALGTCLLLRKLQKSTAFNVIDAHFAYPDGYAATRLGKWLKVPVTITMRGTEVPQSRNPKLRPLLVHALKRADRIFSVSDSLRRHAAGLGIDADAIRVVGNGVDAVKFSPVDRTEARRRLGIPEDARLIVSVGALVERKGFHRIIEIMPELLRSVPDLHYLVVGGASPEGDMRVALEQQAARLGLDKRVHFLGAMPSTELKWPLSASDVFVLATSNEGWANVFLEAMACGLPVITTDVGGNSEVVGRPELGQVVPFGDREALLEAVRSALGREWDGAGIRAYAEANSWETRVSCLAAEFSRLANAGHDAAGRNPVTDAEDGSK